MIDFENKKVLFIDLDSTLIKTVSGKTFPEDITDFRIQLPVLDKIIEKLPNLKRFFIVTNQGGLKSDDAKWNFKAKLYAIEDICESYLGNNLNNFYGSDSMYCSSMDKTDPCRKPNTAMLESLFEEWEVESKDECIMIGDASGKPGDFSDSDKKCAENFGIDYIDVRDFLEL
jgi:DNA 3'-phosphatase